MPFSWRNGASSHHLKTNSYEWSTETIRKQQFQTSKAAASSSLQLASRCTVPFFLSDTGSRRLNSTPISRDKTSDNWITLQITNILLCIAASSFSFHENRKNEIIENYRSYPEECATFGKTQQSRGILGTSLIKTLFNQGWMQITLMKQPSYSAQNPTAFCAKSTTFHKKSPCFCGISSRLSG